MIRMETDTRALLADRFRGVLLGAAIGGALGARLKGAPMQDLEQMSCWREEIPGPLRFARDTYMMLATARSLVANMGFAREHMSEALATCRARAPWRRDAAAAQDASTPQRASEGGQERSGRDSTIAPSFSSGAAIRIAPIGLLHHREPERAAELAGKVARITHDHPIGEDGAVLQACAVAYLVDSAGGALLAPSRLLADLRQHVRTRWFKEILDTVEALGDVSPRTVVTTLGHEVDAHRSVSTALHALIRHRDSFADAVLFAIALGGAADRIGSLTGALAGAALGAAGIPTYWTGQLEGGEELLELAECLLALATEGAPWSSAMASS